MFPINLTLTQTPMSFTNHYYLCGSPATEMLNKILHNTVMKQINVLQAHYYQQKSIILQKELTRCVTIASVTFLFFAKFT